MNLKARKTMFYIASSRCETGLNDQNRVWNIAFLHSLEIFFDFIHADLWLIGKLYDHRIGRIINVCDHNNQLRSTRLVFTVFCE